MNDIKAKLSLLPKEPGCYLMKNKQNQIIYVGKAKVLKNRVSSYFNKVHDYKTTKLVQEIVDFEYIVTNSEKEALLLEINLIKEHTPKYNIMFMDDTYYPYIQITHETHPKLKIVRDAKNKKAKHFGPFPDATAARDIYHLLNRLYPLRKCHKMPDKVCLYYHLKQCLGPCVYPVSQDQYHDIIQSIQRLMNGDVKDIIQDLETKMFNASEAQAYEQALEYKQLIQSIRYVTSKQNVQSNLGENYDVFAYHQDRGYLSIQLFLVREGRLLSREMKLIPLQQQDEVSDIMTRFIVSFYQVNTLPKMVHIQESLDAQMIESIINVKVLQPKRGPKYKMLEMAIKNAKETLDKKFMMFEKQEEKKEQTIELLGEKLGIPTPYRIELFDNSNTQGHDPVSGMVVYLNGQPSKKDYRKFKIQTVEGPDDYQTMKEVLYRRYFRVLKDNLPMPDLLIVDGGLGHVRIAKEVKAMLHLDLPICGLAKDDKHQTSLLINENEDIVSIDKKSELFYFLTRMQDEVHRYAISFHKQLRHRSLFDSILDQVQGLGPKRKKALLKQFGSVKQMKEATLDELTKVIPENVAKQLKEVLSQQ